MDMDNTELYDPSMIDEENEGQVLASIKYFTPNAQ